MHAPPSSRLLPLPSFVIPAISASRPHLYVSPLVPWRFRWEKAGQPCARLYIPILGTLLGLPCIAVMLLATSFYVSIGGLVLEYLVAECWFAPVISVLQNALPPKARGMGIAIFTFTTAICGSFTAWIVGLLADRWTVRGHMGVGGDEDSSRNLRLLLVTITGILYGLCALLFYWARSLLTT